MGIDWASTIDTSTYEEIEYTGITGNELTGVTRGVGGTSAKVHNNGATIVNVISSLHNNRVADRLRSVDAILVNDPNENEIIKTTYVASAVNEITATNAATGNAPGLSATGNDTNIDFSVTGKGSGNVKLGTAALKFPNSDGTSGQVIQTNGSGVLSFTTVSASTDGWLTSSDTFTYVSATSFKITGSDKTTVYTKGTRIKLTDAASTKYFVVTNSSFSTDTTVTITAGTDYTLSGGAITNPYYSYQEKPQGYPFSFAYTPTFAGFSVNPSSYTARFAVVGTMCTVQYYGGTAGTSNATTFTITAPITSKNISNNYITICRVQDSGTSSIAGSLFLGGSSSTINLEKTIGSSASWTNSGSKDAYFTLIYEI